MNRETKLQILRELRDYLIYDATRKTISNHATDEWLTDCRKLMAKCRSTISSGAIERVFDEWVATLPGHSIRVLTPKRAAIIKKALMHYPMGDVLKAVKGWQHDDWEGRAQHNDVTILLRDGGKIEKFRDLQQQAIDTAQERMEDQARQAIPVGPGHGSYNLDRSHRWDAERGEYVPSEEWKP